MSRKTLDYLTPVNKQSARPRLIRYPLGHVAFVALMVNAAFLFAAWFFMNYLHAALFALMSFAINILLALILLWRTPNVRSHSMGQSMSSYVLASLVLPLAAVAVDVLAMSLMGFRWMQS